MDDIDWLAPPEPKRGTAPAKPAAPVVGLPGLPSDDLLVRYAAGYLSAGAEVTHQAGGWVVLRLPEGVRPAALLGHTLHTTADVYALALAIHEGRQLRAAEMRDAIAKRQAVIAEAWGNAAEAARRLEAAGMGDAACRIILEGKG